MTDRDTLLGAIAREPGDEVAWLALADSLEEDGQTKQAALLRLTRQLRGVGRADPLRSDLEGRLTALLKKNFRPMWDGQVYSYDAWFIPKGAPNRDNAVKFLEFIMQPQILADFTAQVSYPPTRQSAMKYVKPDMLPELPTSHFTNAVFLDRVWWADRLDSFSKRFETWLQQ